MSFEADDEILQDFLVEAGEILETLNEELVELEQNPHDADMINSVFRSFHTIKGGAGFLSLTPLVELCHRAEDVFGLIRNGELELTPHMMDVFLNVLDSLNDMFESLKAGEEPDEADPEQIKALDQILHGSTEDENKAEAATQTTEQVPQESSAAQPETDGEQADQVEKDITDEEFEQLLDAIDEDKPQADKTDTDTSTARNGTSDKASQTPQSDDITEEEFDALLDQLHGKGSFNPDVVKSGTESTADKTDNKADTKKEADTAAGKDDEITDEEFEKYLDELHGKGKFAADKIVIKDESTPKADEQKSESDNSVQNTATSSEESTAKPPQEKVTQGVHEPPPPPVKKSVKAKPKAKKEISTSEATVRVDTKRLDDIMNMVGELVLVRNRLVTLENSMANEEISKAVSSLDMVTSDLQTSVMKTRMQPVKKVFGRFPRVVRDISRNLKKEVNLVLVGEDTDLDKNLVEALADPLVHLVRNSVDHGIETPDVRESKGKPRQGTVTLSAAQEGDHILLTIEDDGAGMDPEFLRNRVVEKGLMDADAAARLDDRECYNLIFLPGFSTKDVISDVSGRGVGMDVVRTRIAELNGAVEIDSKLGEGTRISIMVPLTLAIMPTLMVKLHDQSFALPLVSVNEIFHLDLTKTNTIDGQTVIMVREKPLPLFYLTRWLVQGCEYDELPEQGHVVVVHVGTKKVGFVVNELIGQEEVVIKPLGSLLQGTDGLAGATITGDGQIALIVDIPSLMSAHT